jgi:hypothetical protein
MNISKWESSSSKMSKFSQLYYSIKPIVPRAMQIFFRQRFAKIKRMIYRDVWPIDYRTAENQSESVVWPENKDFALVLSHDVDTQKGHDQCLQLLAVEESLGFRSSFNFVPERYRLSTDLIHQIKARGFEVSVHGLKHDGKLFSSRKIFNERAKKINNYIKNWGVEGFTAPSMICNLDWIHILDIKHSTCTFDTDPFEPIPQGVRTIFPFIIKTVDREFVELPYTLPQDHTLFVILQEVDNRIWKQKLDFISCKKGMALLNSHPDYMSFGGRRTSMEEYSYKLYADFLIYIKEHFRNRYWHGLPMEIANYVLSLR